MAPIRTLATAIGLTLLATSAVAAEKETEAPVRVKGEVPVQLRSFSIPTLSSAGYVGRGPITMFLVVRGIENVAELCRYLPRVHEAITVTVDRHPVPAAGRKYDFGAVGERLHRAINRALPKPMVVRLHLLSGAREMAAGKGMLRIEGSTKDCIGLKSLPQDVADMLRSKDAPVETFSAPEPEKPPAPKAAAENEAAAAPAKPPPRRLPKDAPDIIVQRLDKKAPAAAVAGAGAGACRAVADVWRPSVHRVSGAEYWLGRVFTLDENGDGAVDNVGFILKSEDKPDLHIYYFPGRGRQSVITAPTLRLGDDGDVAGVCFGRADFERPVMLEPPAAVKIAPDLAAEMAGRKPGGAAAAPDKAAQPSLFTGSGLIFTVIATAGVLLIVGGAVGFWLARRRAERRRQERRADKDRRSEDRRQADVPRDEPDRRQDEDRRGDDRRKDDDRRT